MSAESWRMSAVLGGFAVIVLVAAPLTAGFSSAWLILFACWLASLFAFLTYVAYERIAYPSKSISEAELFHEVKAIQTAKERPAAVPHEHGPRPRDIKVRPTVSASARVQNAGSVFQWAPVSDRRTHPRLEISNRTDEPMDDWQDDFPDRPDFRPLQGPSPYVE